MHFESAVLEPETSRLLRLLGATVCPEGFYPVGGTALAIQKGHRKSVDLVFFTANSWNSEELASLIRSRIDEQDLRLVNQAPNTLTLNIDKVKIDLIRYGYELLKPLIESPDYNMASLHDIAAMKLSAITNRGSKKDLFDLHQLLKDFSLEYMLQMYREKFPDHETFFVLRALTYFEDAELEPSSITLTSTTWDRIKREVKLAVSSLASES